MHTQVNKRSYRNNATFKFFNNAEVVVVERERERERDRERKRERETERER